MTFAPVVAIESLFLARYAEAAADGTVTMVGGGIDSLVVHNVEQPTFFSVAATVRVAADPGPVSLPLRCVVFDVTGNVVVEMGIEVSAEMTSTKPRRVPIAFSVGGTFAVAGEMRVELSTGSDLRTVSLDVVVA